MKKIPTLFVRERDGKKMTLTNIPEPSCAWVLDGEGVATEKVDGTCCLVRDGALLKRREVKPTESAPADFEQEDFDAITGKRFGWVPVGDGPEDRWHREGFATVCGDGTYELVGPKIQGNPYALPTHVMLRHGFRQVVAPHDSFDAIRMWLYENAVEGIVWHHPDGRMAKIKRRDFGFPWPVLVESPR